MINLKVRFRNPVFISQLVLAFFIPILGYYGLTAQDLTTWGGLFKLILDALSNPYVVMMIVVSLWNAINDPTTKGFTDSPRANNYNYPN